MGKKPFCSVQQFLSSQLAKMDHSELTIAVSSPSETPLRLPELESLLTPLVYDVSQQVQSAMENMLKMTSEIDESLCGIMEDIKKCKESASERRKILEEQKECVQTAAYTVLQMLNAQEIR